MDGQAKVTEYIIATGVSVEKAKEVLTKACEPQHKTLQLSTHDQDRKFIKFDENKFTLGKYGAKETSIVYENVLVGALFSGVIHEGKITGSFVPASKLLKKAVFLVVFCCFFLTPILIWIDSFSGKPSTSNYHNPVYVGGLIGLVLFFYLLIAIINWMSIKKDQQFLLTFLRRTFE